MSVDIRYGNEIRKVGVIGAGQMGSGIAHVCALAGLDVVLNDVSEDRVKAGLATINGNMARQISQQAHHRGTAPGGARRISLRQRRLTNSAIATW